MPLVPMADRRYHCSTASAESTRRAAPKRRPTSKDAELAGIEQQVTLEVWESNQALRTEAENLHNTDILLRKARQSFEVAHGRYKAGVRNILKLLKAQSDLVNAQQKRTLSLTSWQTVRLRLATSLGRLRIDGL